MINCPLELSCFRPGYREARATFLAAVRRLPASLRQSCGAHLHPQTGPQDTPLFCDWVWVGQSGTPERILVLISGTHGIEGFAGSAIQSDCLPLLREILASRAWLGVLLIHALNPWGFAWQRRCDHEGIDLNRNFIDFRSALPGNPVYEQLHADLMAADEIRAEAALLEWQQRLGRDAYETAVTQGQYTHPDGLFFGGTAPGWSRGLLEAECRQPPFQQAERIGVIDLHTGLGPFGYGEVINDNPPDTPGDIHARAWYGDNARSPLLGESCSGPKLGLLDYYWHDLIGERGCFVTLEFGTYSFAQLLSGLRVEQVYHNSYERDVSLRDLDHPSIVGLRQFACPGDISWRQMVLFRGRQIVSLALQGLMQ